MKVTQCPFCKEHLHIEKVKCHKCNISIEGDFYTSPIMSLKEDYQSFIELFVLSSGSLKEMAKIMGVTYPTVRARLDQIIEELKNIMKNREDYKKDILEKVEAGQITAEKAAEIIENL